MLLHLGFTVPLAVCTMMIFKGKPVEFNDLV
jgi:hypothetical protein